MFSLRQFKIFALFVLLFQLSIVAGLGYLGYKIYQLDWSHGLKGAIHQVWEGHGADQK